MLLHAVILQFQVQAIAEDGEVILEMALHAVLIILQDGLGNLALEAGGETNEPCVVLSQDFLVNAGHVVEAFHVGDADKPRQIGIAFIVHCEKDDVIGVVFVLLLVEA
ncbi:MAG: hypothetical protein A4E57_04897 [Syntrophorhabdaceae bacterium PtaU1.Bin034]|nr:MAG: hypothetical protein A4E57_04897 [Syntrophorhabdaceae bacterium PtaU1.Bin034]